MTLRGQNPQNWSVLAVALVCLFTALETVWLRQHHAQWGVHIAAVRGVAYGTPHWRMCQCRLLGPMLVRGAAALTGQSFERCYAPVFFLLLLGANVATFVFFLRASGSGAAAVLCWLASVGLLFVMQDVFWLYLWDIIELSVMLGLVALIHFRAGTWPLVLLWVVALLNRDSWRYVPMWMLLAAGTLWLKQQKQEAIKRALAALVCFVAGQLWVAFITARLFRMETMQVPETRQRIGDLLVELPWNLTKLREGSGWMFVWVSVAMAAGLWLARRRLEERFVPLCLLLAACLVATLCFSRIAETRVFIQYIPFLVWLGWLGVQREQNQANRPGSLELR